MPANKINLTYSAPVGCLDLPAFDFVIRPCDDCLPWHAEVVKGDNMDVWVREWHAVECPEFLELLAIYDRKRGR